MKKSKKAVRPSAINNVIIVSDLHCGCQMGLFPPIRFRLDSGMVVQQSPLQKKVWKLWRFFWDEWVPEVCRGEPFAVVNNAESIDGVHHNSVTQITHNLKDQRNIAKKVLEPIIDRCATLKGGGKAYYHIRGTEVHSGKSAQDEETLAESLGAVPNQHGQCARDVLWLEVGKGLVNIMHHIGSASSTAYEPTALAREMAVAYELAGRWNDRAPNVLVRSHRHSCVEIRYPTDFGYGIGVTTPGWQLPTPFVFRIRGRMAPPQMGGILVRQGDEELYTRSRVWNIERDRIEKMRL